MTLIGAVFGGDDEPDDERTDGGDDLLGGGDDDLLGDDALFADDGEEEESSADELTYRLDEVEKEIDSLGNRLETVRGENEQISESIDTVERNVDKLVELYEIVTQGINPFVGDQELGNAFETATEGGVFGGDDPEDGIDEEIAEADPEELLDDDPMLEDEEDDDFVAEFDEEAVTDEDLGDDEFDDPMADDGFDDDLETDEDPLDVGDDELAAFDADEAEDDRNEPPVATDEGGSNGEIGDPPYLVRHPSRNDAELATLEWLQFLVEEAGVDGAAETIAYYESVGWISEGAESYLLSVLNGFGGESSDDPTDEPEPRSALSPDEHKRSLQYIARIATPEKAPDLLEGEIVDEAIAATE